MEFFKPLYNFSKNKFAEVEKNGKKGIIHANGTEIVPVDYNYVARAMPGYFLASGEKGYTFFDESGRRYPAANE